MLYLTHVCVSSFDPSASFCAILPVSQTPKELISILKFNRCSLWWDISIFFVASVYIFVLIFSLFLFFVSTEYSDCNDALVPEAPEASLPNGAKYQSVVWGRRIKHKMIIMKCLRQGCWEHVGPETRHYRRNKKKNNQQKNSLSQKSIEWFIYCFLKKNLVPQRRIKIAAIEHEISVCLLRFYCIFYFAHFT